MIQSAQAGDILFFYCGSKVAEDSCISVGRIGHNQAFNIRFGDRECLSLLHKNFLINLKKIFALHSWFSWKSSKKDNDVSMFKLFLNFIPIGDLNSCNFTERTRGQLQSYSSRVTPLRTLCAAGMSNNLMCKGIPGKQAPLHSCGMKEQAICPAAPVMHTTNGSFFIKSNIQQVNNLQNTSWSQLIKKQLEFKAQIIMQDDPVYTKMLEKSHIMRNYHRSHQREPVPQVKKEPKITHKVIATGVLSTIIHIIAYPLDTIKVRKIAKSTVHDAAKYQINQVSNLTPYLGFIKGYLSIIIGNMCFLTLGQQSFALGVLGEALLKTFVDISKISTQMGNQEMKMDLLKKVLPLATTFAILRDFTSRGSYMLIVNELIARNQEWIQQDHNRKYHLFFGGAILATIISHPFDVFFTKVASQRSLRYDGLFGTIKTLLKQQGPKKLMSGIECRLTYNLIGAIIMGNAYNSVLEMSLEVL